MLGPGSAQDTTIGLGMVPAEAAGYVPGTPDPMQATYRHSNLPQDVLRNCHVFLKHLPVELVQGCVHKLHADPHISLWVNAQRSAHARLRQHLCLGSLPWCQRQPGLRQAHLLILQPTEIY